MRVKETWSFIFFRDPLERFLSAYIDKCVTRNHREGHCRPNKIFQNIQNDSEPLFSNLNEKQKFEAFIDVSPLSWDLHFYPQAAFCNNMELLSHYKFIGIMNETFNQQLVEVQNILGIVFCF